MNREEETQNTDSHAAARTQLKLNNQHSYPSKMISKLERTHKNYTTKQGPNTKN